MRVRSFEQLKRAAKFYNDTKQDGTIWIANDIDVTESIDFKTSVSLRGYGIKPLITSRVSPCFSWRRRQRPQSEHWYAGSMASGGRAEFFEHSEGVVERGDWVAIKSEDELPIAPHHRDGANFPLELHQVQHVRGNRIYVAGHIVDDMQTAVMWCRWPMAQGVTVADLSFEWSSGVDQHPYAVCLLFNATTGNRVENVDINRDGAGSIQWQMSAEATASGIRIGGSDRLESVYGIVAGCVNGLIVSDFAISGTRHAFTTTAGSAAGSSRWGTPLNVRLNNGIVNCPTKVDSDRYYSTIGLDTHSEGFGVTFSDITVNTGTATGNYAAHTRSRATEFRNCRFFGSLAANTAHLMVDGPDTQIAGCTFDGGWMGVFNRWKMNHPCDGTLIRDCTFHNVRQPIRLQRGKYDTHNNVYRHCDEVPR